MALQDSPLRVYTSRPSSMSSVRIASLRATPTKAGIREQATSLLTLRQRSAHASFTAHNVPEQDAFDLSFAQALNVLVKSPKVQLNSTKGDFAHDHLMPLDGQYDHDEQFQLLRHNDSTQSLPLPESPATVIRVHINPNPVSGPYPKSKPSRGIYLSHEVCHNSQYTRPATDILRDILDLYPAAPSDSGQDARLPRDSSEAELGLLNGAVAPRKQWWKRMLGMR